jgi:hypothetical protein
MEPCRYLCNEDSPKPISHRCINTNHIKLHILFYESIHLNFEILAIVFQWHTIINSHSSQSTRVLETLSLKQQIMREHDNLLYEANNRLL